MQLEQTIVAVKAKSNNVINVSKLISTIKLHSLEKSALRTPR